MVGYIQGFAAAAGRIVTSFLAEMVTTAATLFEERRAARLRDHLDWSETAQRNRRLRR